MIIPSLAGMYDSALAASGMLGTIATYLASDNAAGIAEMAGMVCKLCEITDALDARMGSSNMVKNRRG